jgi:hypothetical protein
MLWALLYQPVIISFIEHLVQHGSNLPEHLHTSTTFMLWLSVVRTSSTSFGRSHSKEILKYVLVRKRGKHVGLPYIRQKDILSNYYKHSLSSITSSNKLIRTFFFNCMGKLCPKLVCAFQLNPI